MMDEEAFRQGCNELADAILQGYQTTFQIRGKLWERDDTGTIIGCCSIGSACLVKWGSDHEEPSEDKTVIETFPVLQESVYWPGETIAHTFLYIIIILNDSRDWTPEQIAAWVRTAKRVSTDA